MAEPYEFGFVDELVAIHFPPKTNETIVAVELSYNTQSYSSGAPFPALEFIGLTNVGTRVISGSLLVVSPEQRDAQGNEITPAGKVVPVKDPITQDMFNNLSVWSRPPAQQTENIIVPASPTDPSEFKSTFQWAFHALLFFNITPLSFKPPTITNPNNSQKITCQFLFPQITSSSFVAHQYGVSAQWAIGTSSVVLVAIAPGTKTIANYEASVLAQHPDATFVVTDLGPITEDIDTLKASIRVTSYRKQTAFPVLPGGFVPAWDLLTAVSTAMKSTNQTASTASLFQPVFTCDPKTLKLTLT